MLLAATAAVAVGGGPQTARAIVVTPPEPSRAPAAAPTPQPLPANATVLPLNSSLFFVLDGTISSRASAGTMVRAHLRDPIVLHGTTIAPAGSPVQIRIVQTQKALMANQDGSAEIFFEPLVLADSKTLPLITPTAHLDPHMSAGRANTRGITDTVGDIFIPGHYLYHILRKGMDVDLRPGTVIRARTGASVDIGRGQLAIETPPPLPQTSDTPHPAFAPAPLAMPPGFHPSTPKPAPSKQPI